MKDSAKMIERTIHYIEEHLQDDLNLNSIAKYTNYSKYHLNRLFSDTVGCTIHKYIQKRRLTEAAKMLVYTNIPIAQVALDASYESQQAFTLVFRGLYLMTPLLYRETGEFKPLQLVFGIVPKEQRVSVNSIYTAHSQHLLRYGQKAVVDRLYNSIQYKKEMKAA